LDRPIGGPKVELEGIEDMKGLGIWMQAISRWLVAWLITKWGVALVLIGTLALAGSASVYLTSTYDQRAQVGGSVPGATQSVPAQSLCTTMAVGGALTCTSILPDVLTHCTPSPLVVGPDITCDDR
jgi:hypothetical protein